MHDKGRPQDVRVDKGRPRTVALAELASRQHGVVSIRQLEKLIGYSREGVRQAVGAGRLHLVHRGVYTVGYEDLSLHGQCLAAVLAAGQRSLLSYWSAGWLWGLLQSAPRPFHVTAPNTRRLRARPPIRIHRARNLVYADRWLVEQIPVTSAARTYLDLAEVVKVRRVPKLLKRGEDLGIFDFDAVLACCERSRGHKGSKPLRRALMQHRPRR
jgi:predicted transcriptional regulator of viral defense system